MRTEMQELIEAAEAMLKVAYIEGSGWDIGIRLSNAISVARASEGGWIDHTPDYLLGRCIPFLDTAAYYGNKDAKELRGEIVNYAFDLPSLPLSVEKEPS